MQQKQQPTYLVSEKGVSLEDGTLLSMDQVVEKLNSQKKTIGTCLDIINDQTLHDQCAFIEWQRGKGAEAAMERITRQLILIGQIPHENEDWANDPELYYCANKSDAMPLCSCGKPSSIGDGKKSACCREHLESQEQTV